MPKYPIKNHNYTAKNPCEFCLDADMDLVINGEDGCKGGCEEKRTYDCEIKKQTEQAGNVFEVKSFKRDTDTKEIKMPKKN